MTPKSFDRKTQRVLVMTVVALTAFLAVAAASDAGGRLSGPHGVPHATSQPANLR